MSTLGANVAIQTLFQVLERAGPDDPRGQEWREMSEADKAAFISMLAEQVPYPHPRPERETWSRAEQILSYTDYGIP